MGNDISEVLEGLPSCGTVKIHAQTCSELLKLVTAVSNIFPEIDAARPRCSSGIEALCSLNNGILRAKSLLQHCRGSSVLYLALTGEAIISRCRKSSSVLERSLCQIQGMVPEVLAEKIAGIIAELRSATFSLLPSEEGAGKILKELLHRYGSSADATKEDELSAICTVSSLLHIESQNSLTIEKLSIRETINKFGEREPTKRKILLFFLNLLNKYGEHILEDQRNNYSIGHGEPFFPESRDLTDKVESVNYMPDEAQNKMFCRPVPPEEFMCPLTMRLMYDPVVIASGQTYERMWIQKWFDEGNNVCPKTKVKLLHLSLTSDTVMKDLILNWCATHNLSIRDPEIRGASVDSTPSIPSLSGSMNDLNIPLDFTGVPFISSLDSLQLHAKISSCIKSSSEIDVEYLSKFSSLPWDSRCNGIENFRRLLNKNHAFSPMVPLDEFIQLLFDFLKEAHDLCDVEARTSGCLLLLEFVQRNRACISIMKEDAYSILASLLDTEAARQVVLILEVLSSHQHGAHKIAASGALFGVISVLENQIQELLQPSLKILNNLSSNGVLGSIINTSNFFPKLVPLFDDNSLATCCVAILKDMCDTEEAQLSIIETSGCLSAIAEQLYDDSLDNQECAVSILLSLCSHGAPHCQLVMSEGVIPGLVRVSFNGNNKAKAIAIELLRILKEKFGNAGENLGSEIATASTKQQKDKNPPHRSMGFFGRFFSKPAV